MTNSRQLIELGYQAAIAGEPCEAPTTTELGRGAWEQGWRAGKRDPRSRSPKIATAITCPECGNQDKFTIWQGSETAVCGTCQNNFSYDQFDEAETVNDGK